MKTTVKSKKTIHDAVKHLPKDQAKQIKRAWRSAHCRDLYDGNLSEYLGVIANSLEYYRRKFQITHNAAHKAVEILQAPYL